MLMLVERVILQSVTSTLRYKTLLHGLLNHFLYTGFPGPFGQIYVFVLGFLCSFHLSQVANMLHSVLIDTQLSGRKNFDHVGAWNIVASVYGIGIYICCRPETEAKLCLSD